MRKEEQRLLIKDGYSLRNGRLIIPENTQWKILKGVHQSFRLGVESTSGQFSSVQALSRV